MTKKLARPFAIVLAFGVGAALSLVGPERSAVGYHSYTPSASCGVASSTGPNLGLVNMGFESDLTGWRLGTVVDDVAISGADAFTAPFQGAKMVRLGRARSTPSEPQPKGPNEICQDFIVDRPVESFAFRLFTWDTEGSDHFQFRLAVIDPATGQVVDRYNTTAWDFDTLVPTLRKTGWTIVTVDLSAHMGQTLHLWFSAGGGGASDDDLGFWAYVDQATKDVKAVNLLAKPRKPKLGKKTTLIATVAPCLGHVGHPVEFQQRTKGGWKVVGAGSLDLFCQTSVKKRVKEKMRFRAFSPESGDHFEAYSDAVKVKPKGKKGKK